MAPQNKAFYPQPMPLLPDRALPSYEPRVVQPVVSQQSVQEIRVVETPHTIKEPRVVFPTLAIANPVHTAPLVPLTIVALTSTPYPPPPDLPPLPNTDKLNHLLCVLVSAPTIPTAPPTRRSKRPHNKRTSDYAYYSVVAAPITPILMPSRHSSW